MKKPERKEAVKETAYENPERKEPVKEADVSQKMSGEIRERGDNEV